MSTQALPDDSTGIYEGRTPLLPRPLPPPPHHRTAALTALCCAALAANLLATPVRADGSQAAAAQPGAYCPLPEKGDVPACLTPAQAQYGEFFAGLESGEFDERQTSVVEADLAASDETERSYLALSSLSYGYYRLAQRLSNQRTADPALLARLAHWNQLLLEVYEGDDAAKPFREAVRQAAVDLHTRAPAVGETCKPTANEPCRGAEGLVRALAAIDARAGLRSPLTRLMSRIFGDTPSLTGRTPAEDDSQ